MSGTVAVPNLFVSAVTATGQQLDTNFATLAAYSNDPTNRNNFGVDTGTGGTYTVSITPPAVAYTAGLFVQWQAVNASSANANVNISGLGNLPIQFQGGLPVGAGQISAGGIVSGVVKGGTAFVMPTPIGAASSAQVSAATFTGSPLTDPGIYITPLNSIFLPQVAKAWGGFVGTVTGTTSFGSGGFVTAAGGLAFATVRVSREGTGTYSITTWQSFGTNFIVICSAAPTAGLSIASVPQSSKAAQQFNIVCVNAATAAVDAAFVNFLVYGTN